ncbi:hypothetical protein EZ428_10710 [Pedobacter frigiditerrae]|uniref:Uncharacterized protein n=1 Tax=Pedobacter frigiditerrae TaxID=2530452 RepID=A0A4R0MY15_9SPHI|nr:hypothetical protein [Pedobacter frigiditerrae]TCC92191.1 hypothetical protein EZ428_10710 [Pedobacter frigiditerrae]
MEPFKNIRTSILPFGYNKTTKSYRFSLCIDLNPNYSDDQAVVDRDELRRFILTYANDANSISSLLIKNLSINLYKTGEKNIPVKSSAVCFPTITSQIVTAWNSLPINSYTTRGNNETPGYAQGLDISIAHTIPIFKTKTGTIPDGQQLRRSMMMELESEKMDIKSLKPLVSPLRAGLKSVNDDIENFSNMLSGISSFSEQVNAMETNSLLKSTKKKYTSIYDNAASMLEFWSFIDSNAILQRVMGQIIDFEIKEDELKKYISNYIDKQEFDIVFSFSDDVLKEVAKLTKLTWEHLITPCRIYPSMQVILVREENELDKIPIQIQATNYDIGGKLVGLKAIKEKYEKYLDILDDASVNESEKYQIRKQLMTLDTAAMTIGVNTYNLSLPGILVKEKQIEAAAESNNTVLPNYLYRIRSGYRFAVKSVKSVDLTPIGLRTVSLKGTLGNKINLPNELSIQDIGINTDSGAHAFLRDKEGVMVPQIIADQAMNNWGGENIGMPSVFSNQENEENFESTVDEGAVSDSIKFVTEQLSKFFIEDYEIKGVEYKRNAHKGDQDSKLHTDIANLPIQLSYSLNSIQNKKLIFGREIQVFLTPEYKNKYAIPTALIPKLKDENSHCLTTQKFIFKRNEPVKPIEFRLYHQLVEESGAPIEEREGESVTNLVIRNFSNVDNDEVYVTNQTSIRHILPPAISFQQAIWHNKLFNNKHNPEGMSVKESYKWYLKHHYPINEGEISMQWDKNNEWSPVLLADGSYRKNSLKEAIDGSTRMRDFYNKSCDINYLPDPLSKGFTFQFFRDKDRLIKAKEYEKYEDYEYYFTGSYPEINAWKIILVDYEPNDIEMVLFDKSAETIWVRIEKGSEIFVTARTILAEDYSNQMETFGNNNQFTRFGGNDLLTPPLEFTLVHAIQRPLIRPKFGNMTVSKKELDQTNLSLTITTNLEQLYSYKDNAGITRYLENTKPTGNIEVYAKWEEYLDDPKHVTSDNWTPLMPVNDVDLKKFTHINKKESPAIFEFNVDVSPQLLNMEKTLNKISSLRNDFKNYAVDLNASYDIRETKYLKKVLWIKNKSQFTSYYPKNRGVEDDESLPENSWQSKEYYNRLSAIPYTMEVLNSRKPAPPQISDQKRIKLISVIEDWQEGPTFKRGASMNRLRIFFERGRLTSGNGERIGFIVNEPAGTYNDQMVKNNLVSMVGKDIISDTVKPFDGSKGNNEVLLSESNFVIRDPQYIYDNTTKKPKADLESFTPKYVKDLGIMTYLPKFDKKLNLWYVDVELDIKDENGKQLHNPFLKFALVHYQEKSFNYNKTSENNLIKDCRISNVYQSGFAYIMGSRLITVEFGKGYVKPAIEFDVTSLKGKSSDNRSRFFAVVREKYSNSFAWKTAKKTDATDAFFQLSNGADQLPKRLDYKNNNDKNYQLVIIETEHWEDSNPSSFDQLIENKNNRVVLVSTFNLE